MVALVVVSLAVPVRDLVAQHSRITSLEDRAVQAQSELEKMNSQIARWNDPAFVATQARERLHFVLPGEVGYVVLEAEAAPVLYKGTVTKQRSQSWYGALWGGIKAAGKTAAPAQATAKKSAKAKKTVSPKPSATH